MTPKARALFEQARNAATAARWSDALRASRDLVAAAPNDAQAARLRAMILTQTGDDDARTMWERVLALAPGDAEAHFQLGNAAGDRGDFVTAVAHLEAARAKLPDHPVLLNNLGLALEGAGRVDAAIDVFRRAVGVDPRAAPHIGPSLVRALLRAARYEEGLSHLDALLPDCVPASAWHDYARLLLAARRYEETDAVLTRAHDALPDDTLVSSLLVVSRQRRGAWEGTAALRNDLIARVASHPWTGNASGYDFTTVCDDPALQRRVAERYAASEVDTVAAASRSRHHPPAQASSRLRLGFVSSDYRDHPVGRLVVGLFERLDRGAFEVVAYSTGVSADPLGARIELAVDRFTALPRHAPDEAAQRIRNDEIDVLFDLNGFSGGEALRIFARRPASLQVNFLGYTGTLGTDIYDAIVADLFCIPADASRRYVERPLYIEPCYLPSDPTRAADPTPRRADYGLADDAVVLYAGGPLYKVTPEFVDAWLAILRDVPASVLWLRDPGSSTRARVEAHAHSRGLDTTRLRFAPDEPLARYLARFGLAELVLDTWPFGSHTTVNDALFMGAPVVTQTGRSFASRASTSQLRAVGRGDLAAESLAGYVDIARRLASDSVRRADVSASLGDVRGTPLFAADRYAARFAEAITHAWKTLRR